MAVVEAAGGVVVDFSAKKVRYLVAHRPRYDDWTMPKGHIEPGEKPRQAALREVHEETGLKCETLAKLSSVSYLLPDGRTKRVRYWLMRPVSGKFKPNSEVDAVTWLKRTATLNLLTYTVEQGVVLQAHLRAKELRKHSPSLWPDTVAEG